jgi:hypothetical protein
MRIPTQIKAVNRFTTVTSKAAAYSLTRVYPSQILLRQRIPTFETTCQGSCCGNCSCCANHGNAECCKFCRDKCPKEEPPIVVDWPHPDAPIVVLGAIALPSFLGRARVW